MVAVPVVWQLAKTWAAMQAVKLAAMQVVKPGAGDSAAEAVPLASDQSSQKRGAESDGSVQLHFVRFSVCKRVRIGVGVA